MPSPKGMLNLEKWNGQTIESVKHCLEKAALKGLPCVGHCLVYMDYQGDGTIDWKYETNLAFDPNNPPSPEQREKLERIFEGYAMLAQKMMDGERKLIQ